MMMTSDGWLMDKLEELAITVSIKADKEAWSIQSIASISWENGRNKETENDVGTSQTSQRVK